MSDADWVGLDQKAMSVICLSLTKNVAFNILKEKTAKRIMEALSNMYEKSSAENKVFLIREVVNTRMKNGTSVTEHINKLNSILARLLSVCIKFNDEVQALLLLLSLPDSSSGTVKSVTSLAAPDRFSFEKIRDLVLGEDIRRSSAESSKESLNIVRGRGNKREDKQVNIARGSASDEDSLVMNSVASFHATHRYEALQNLVIGDFGKVRLAGDRALDVTGMSDIVLKTPVDFWTLKDVRVLLALKKSLMQLDEQGHEVKFENGQWKVVKRNLVMARGRKREDDIERAKIDALLQSWTLSTVSKEITDFIIAFNSIAHALWTGTSNIFRDNKSVCLTQLEHRFRMTVISTKSITEYCEKLKNLVDCLDDVDAHVFVAKKTLVV
ncbi:unnamed protein product [Cuscuta campestris]|uniref:Retrovirus-related Pol polyprotein from transposon TNT 1-94 n=1 Tax=Cuscuta campestris TaxID=132261 RepID=A0A484L7R7_9ASTE|nr:unnamed protein product [Cuscuta campestris]